MDGYDAFGGNGWTLPHIMAVVVVLAIPAALRIWLPLFLAKRAEKKGLRKLIAEQQRMWYGN